jgi:hypothetical protein
VKPALSLSLALAVAGCGIAHDRMADAGGESRVLMPCGPEGGAGTGRDCGWSIGGPISCRAGQLVQVGCNAACGLGTCTGDSMIRVCDGAPCTAARALAQNDDASCSGGGGVCSFIDGVICPPSGQLYVLTAPFGVGSPYTCSFVARTR